MTLISEKIRSKIRDVYDFIPIPMYHPGWILCPQPPRPRPLSWHGAALEMMCDLTAGMQRDTTWRIENLVLDEQWTAQHNSQRQPKEFEIETFWNNFSNSLHFRRTPNYGCFSSKFWNCVNSFSRTNAEFCGGTEIYQQHARFGLDWQQRHSDTLLNKKTNEWQGW